MSAPLILLGSGGHGRVLLDILLQQSIVILAIADPKRSSEQFALNIPIINDDEVLQYPAGEVCLVNGLGSISDTTKRRQIYEHFKEYKYDFITVSHSSAVISPRAMIGEGVQVMAGAIIQTGVKVACNSIVNTKASIDHDCTIGKHVHIAPGATLSGGIQVGDEAHIGAGATILQGINIGKRAVIGAGSVVIRDIPENAVAVGAPTRIIKYRE
jgi:UDP-perosamine 4-acetyltransferase